MKRDVTAAPAPDVRTFLRSLVGQTILTYRGRPNTILAVTEDQVLVATTRSPEGKLVPIEEVQAAADQLHRDGEIEISVEVVGYRSAFVGAVLSRLPGARWGEGATVTLKGDTSRAPANA